MASQHRPDLGGLDRPRLIGQRIAERFGLIPPVDIRALLDQYAEVEIAEIPADCDALVIGLNDPSVVRPKVIVNPRKPPRRRRFSMGHELGHILIPGHISGEACFMDEGFYGASTRERDAHSFASEVLMPTRWLAEIIAASADAGEIFEAAEVADVSASAAMLSINRLLPPGHIVVLMKDKIAEMVLASPLTTANLPEQGKPLDARVITPLAGDHGSFAFSGRRIMWWAFDETANVTPEADGHTSNDVLAQILLDVFPDEPGARAHALASINGVAGWAKGGFAAAASVEEMAGRLRGRFASRPKHAKVIAHPLFETYLAKKARELKERP
ncbi:MAG TPA: ImmA/IrrE family metallo-endopeptidase [Gaiellaceae bacterium]|nr:ImmA/IrrE family metallo-endopeptidase [Gaiellaceae bacterium]